MTGIRSLPDVRREVEEYITRLKSMVPPLSSDPTAGGFHTAMSHDAAHVNFAPSAVDKTPVSTSRYIYVAELGKAIPMVESLSDLPSTTPVQAQTTVDSSDSESDCSEDELCQIEPEPGMRFAWRRHSDGRKFFKPVPIKPKQPEKMFSYQLDKATGNYEQVLVTKKQQQPPLTKQKKAAKGQQTPVYRDHRVTHLRGVKVLARKEERQPSFVSSDPEKQGKDSRIPSLIQYARDCPVSWTSKVTTSNLNPILFSWAYIAELLATRTGQSPSLHDGELEARLQHFLSVIEVTLQTTTQSDFSSDSWKVARLYHEKVQDKVDTGTYSWLGLA